MAALFLHMSASNNFLTVDNRKLQYTIRSTDNLEDFKYMNESKKRAQITKKGAVLGGCYRICKPSECATSHELLIQVEERQIAEMVLDQRTIQDELSNYSNYTGAISRSRGGFKDIKFHCINNFNGKKCETCLAQIQDKRHVNYFGHLAPDQLYWDCKSQS